MCNRTKSIVREFGSSQELARTVRSSSKVSNPTFQPLIGSQEPTPQVLVPVINIILFPNKNGVGTLWLNLNRLSRLVPCGKRYFTFAVKPGTLQISNSSSYHQLQASVAPTLHSNKNGRENMFFTERRHSEPSALGLTGSYETGRIALSEVRKKCANSILVRRGASPCRGPTRPGGKR